MRSWCSRCTKRCSWDCSSPVTGCRPRSRWSSALAINPNTVLKAYRDLEREGLVRARPGLGTFVVGRLPRTDPRAQAKFRRSMAAWLRSARAAGLTAAEIEAIYRTAFRACFADDEGAA